MGSTLSLDKGIDRKSLKKPDGFVVALNRFFGKLSSQSHGVLIGVGVVFLLSLGAAYWMNHREAQSEASRNSYFLAEKSLETEMKALVQSEVPVSAATSLKDKKPNPADAKAEADKTEALWFKKLDVDQKFPKTVQDFKTVEQKYSHSRAAFDARLKLGRLYFNHGEFGKALPWFQKAADSGSGFEKAIALSSLGYTYENLGKTTEAIQSYEKAMQIGEGSLKGDLLLGIARSYETAHDVAKARSSYDQILKDLPNTEYSKSAELYKSQLQ